MKDQLRYLELSESCVLGWKLDGSNLSVFLEVLLGKGHPLFRPYDEKKEFGCYRLGVVHLCRIADLEGLDEALYRPIWDTELNEYRDIAEIDRLVVEGNRFLMGAGDINFTMAFEEFGVEVLEDERFAW